MTGTGARCCRNSPAARPSQPETLAVRVARAPAPTLRSAAPSERSPAPRTKRLAPAHRSPAPSLNSLAPTRGQGEARAQPTCTSAESTRRFGARWPNQPARHPQHSYTVVRTTTHVIATNAEGTRTIRTQRRHIRPRFEAPAKKKGRPGWPPLFSSVCGTTSSSEC